ncbi:Hpt domain-containing protein [Oligoflexus tunisiensis]|uniref:Hpt domain-containing protein n=1 Tax=Oligoflexus tunisiensis TaxID=708132 RepID=UPI00114D0DF4|nr:Hpt domain-containing protein [Oligoflexus tunisiensis]
MSSMPQNPGLFVNTEDQMVELTSSSPILNAALIEQYEAMDEGVTDDALLPKIFGIFHRNIPEHLERLTVALQSQDEETVNYVIHKMLGMAHNVGALRLSDILMILEQAETATKMHLTGNEVAMLQREFEAAVAALQEHLDQRTH